MFWPFDLTPHEEFSMNEFRLRQQRYVEMPSEELRSLSDDELFEAVMARTEAKVDQKESLGDGLKSLSHPEQVFYVTSLYETEVNNGGLCQYFVNSSRVTATFLAKHLEEISAADHKALFTSFVSANGIDVTDLSSFTVEDEDEFISQTERFPFDDFDSAFYELTPIQDYLVPYVRSRIDSF